MMMPPHVESIVIFGGQGWIGSMFVEQFKQMYPSVRVCVSSLRVVAENHQAIERECLKHDRVVCMIGRTTGYKDGRLINNIDFLEDHLLLNIRDNLYGPMMLSIICMRHNIHYSYLGTGCIFSWDTNIDTEQRVSEQAQPNFFGSAYSTIKSFTDTLPTLNPYMLNWRVRMPIVNYHHPKNFITKIASYKLIHNTNNSMSYLPNLVPIMCCMVFEGATGTFNMTNPGFLNHKQILEAYQDQLNVKCDYEIVDDDTRLNLGSKRSSNIMDTSAVERWCQRYNLRLMHINECLQECLLSLSNNTERPHPDTIADGTDAHFVDLATYEDEE